MIQTHYGWPSIEQLSHAKRNLKFDIQCIGKDKQDQPIFNESIPLPKLKYVGTVKLHGTCAGVVFCNNGEIYAQSRENVITPEKDNAGFARFIANLSENDKNRLISYFPDGWEKVAIYGEWAGPGIQKNVAISQISQKSFFIFGARLIDDNKPDEEVWLPTELWAKDKANFDSPIYFIQWYPCYEVDVDFDDPAIVDRLTEWVDAIDKECPVGKAFGINSHGEGLVFRPVGIDNSRYWYKVKGASHSKSVARPVVSLDIEQFNNINEFLDRVLDNGRLEQGITKLKEQHKEVSQKSTGDYLKWLTGDVVKECSIEMKDSGLDEKEVLKQVQIRGRKWFFDTLNKQ